MCFNSIRYNLKNCACNRYNNLKKFQFHKVQFKGLKPVQTQEPEAGFNSIRYNLKLQPPRAVVGVFHGFNSIRYNLKRTRENTLRKIEKFQFHKVQFKADFPSLHEILFRLFQFHKVQFKVIQLGSFVRNCIRFNSIRYNLKRH